MKVRSSFCLDDENIFIFFFSIKDVIWPADGARELPIVPKAPMFNPELGEAPKSTTKRLIEIRGPELVHTDFKHKQYGIVVIFDIALDLAEIIYLKY